MSDQTKLILLCGFSFRFKEYGTLLKVNNSTILDDGRMLVDAVGDKRFKVFGNKPPLPNKPPWGLFEFTVISI